MGRIGDIVANFLVDRNWESTQITDNVFALSVAGQSNNWTTYLGIREEESQILVHSVLPVRVPPDRIVEVALFLTRANFGLVIGNFELDMDDGEVRFKTSVDLEGVDFTDLVVDHLVLAAIVTSDRYLPGLVAVLAGRDAVSSIEAVEKTED